MAATPRAASRRASLPAPACPHASHPRDSVRHVERNDVLRRGGAGVGDVDAQAVGGRRAGVDAAVVARLQQAHVGVCKARVAQAVAKGIEHVGGVGHKPGMHADGTCSVMQQSVVLAVTRLSVVCVLHATCAPRMRHALSFALQAAPAGWSPPVRAPWVAALRVWPHAQVQRRHGGRVVGAIPANDPGRGGGAAGRRQQRCVAAVCVCRGTQAVCKQQRRGHGRWRARSWQAGLLLPHQVMGRRPDGLTRPNRRSAIARPPSYAGVCTCAGGVQAVSAVAWLLLASLAVLLRCC